jgi:hypothetical protein
MAEESLGGPHLTEKKKRWLKLSYDLFVETSKFMRAEVGTRKMIANKNLTHPPPYIHGDEQSAIYWLLETMHSIPCQTYSTIPVCVPTVGNSGLVVSVSGIAVSLPSGYPKSNRNYFHIVLEPRTFINSFIRRKRVPPAISRIIPPS